MRWLQGGKQVLHGSLRKRMFSIRRTRTPFGLRKISRNALTLAYVYKTTL